LSREQQQARLRHTFRSSFTLTDCRMHDHPRPSFFLDLHRTCLGELAQRLHVDESILDYNYERLFKLIDMMINERTQYRFNDRLRRHNEDLPVADYAATLEFYLQIDRNYRLRRLFSLFSLLLFYNSSRSFLYEDMFVSRRQTMSIQSYGPVQS
jgi:hypothetical protein